jgi:hypothetical protein
VWIKIIYYPASPKHPPFLKNGEVLVRLEKALPILAQTNRSIPPPNVSGWYLNLDVESWSALRDGTDSPILIAWSDSSNQQCSVVFINLRTDVVDIGVIDRKDLNRRYNEQRILIGRVCPSVRLPEVLP